LEYVEILYKMPRIYTGLIAESSAKEKLLLRGTEYEFIASI